MKDAHIHTVFSHDGGSTVGEYIEAAQSIGIDELTFTEHWDDYDGIESKLETLDVSKYREAFLLEQEKTDFKINFGIEIGLQPHIAEKIEAVAKSYPFDFIIGSSHITRQMDMAYDTRFFDGLTRRDAYLRYFDEMLENIKMCADSFDVYGHMDYVVRYGGYAEKSIEYKEFSEVLDEIFKSLISHGRGIELNTAGYRYGLGAPHPNIELLKRYRELGGEILTLGSDAHRASDLGSHFSDAREIIETAGFKYVAFFHQRQPEFITIKEFFE